MNEQYNCHTVHLCLDYIQYIIFLLCLQWWKYNPYVINLPQLLSLVELRQLLFPLKQKICQGKKTYKDYKVPVVSEVCQYLQCFIFDLLIWYAKYVSKTQLPSAQIIAYNAQLKIKINIVKFHLHFSKLPGNSLCPSHIQWGTLYSELLGTVDYFLYFFLYFTFIFQLSLIVSHGTGCVR